MKKVNIRIRGHKIRVQAVSKKIRDGLKSLDKAFDKIKKGLV